MAQALGGQLVALDGQHAELVAAPPSDEVVCAYGLRDRGARPPQVLVAGGVAVAVVDRLEAVEVDGEHGGRQVEAPTASLLALERLVPRAAVCEPRQAIGRRRALARPQPPEQAGAELHKREPVDEL